MSAASFSPVTITAETMGVLRQQKNYSDLLALYITYVEITQWQSTKTIKATTSFMMKRMGWGKDKLQERKAALAALNLIADINARDKNGKMSGSYVAVNYVVSAPVDSRSPENTASGEINPQVLSNRSLSAKKEKIIESASASMDASPNLDFDGSGLPTASPPHSAAPPPQPDETLRMFFVVVKKYGLAPQNRNHYKKWARDLEKMISPEYAELYLKRLIERDIRAEAANPPEGIVVPTLNVASDIVMKAHKFVSYFKKTRKNQTAVVNG